MLIRIDKPGNYKLVFDSDVEDTTPVVVTPEPAPEPVPEPPPPIVTDPIPPPVIGNKREKLVKLFSDPSLWSKPVEVYDFKEPSGGVYIPFTADNYMQQDRAGGKIRWFRNGEKTNVFVRDDRGVEVPAFIHDAKWHEGKLYGVFMLHDELWIGKCINHKERKPLFFLDIPVPFQGAKDTKHALEVNDHNRFAIYGRLRHGGGVDWQEEGEPLGPRRGQRRVIVKDAEIVINEVYFDPMIEQPGYEHNQYRFDFYATRICSILGFDVQLISIFQKNGKRIPSTRPERTSGTGPIIPIIAIGRDILSYTDTVVPLDFLKRRTQWEEAHPYEPEVGQVYGVGLTYDESTGRADLYFNNREDLHYLADKDKPRKNVKVYRITAYLK